MQLVAVESSGFADYMCCPVKLTSNQCTCYFIIYNQKLKNFEGT